MGGPNPLAVAVTPDGDAIAVGQYRAGDDTDLGPSDTFAYFDTNECLYRLTTDGTYVGGVPFSRLAIQSLAFDATGSLYIAVQLALSAGEEVALGPDPGAPTFTAPADDSYFALVVLAP